MFGALSGCPDTWGVAQLYCPCSADATRTVRPISFSQAVEHGSVYGFQMEHVDVKCFSVVVPTPGTVNAVQCGPLSMFKASVNNWVSGSVGVTGATLRTLCADVHHWRSSATYKHVLLGWAGMSESVLWLCDMVQSRSDLEEVEKWEVNDWSSWLLRDNEEVTVKPGSCSVADYLANIVLLHRLYQRSEGCGLHDRALVCKRRWVTTSHGGGGTQNWRRKPTSRTWHIHLLHLLRLQIS